VGPHEVDLDLMRRHIAAFRAGATRVQAPRVDYPTDSFLTQTYDFAGVRVLIAEGTYVLTFDDLDVRVFLTATHEATRERRRTRNRDIDAPVIEQVLAIEHRIIAPLAERADFLIDESFAVHGAGRAGDRRQEHPGVTDRRAHHE
jgi:uridine kinase